MWSYGIGQHFLKHAVAADFVASLEYLTQLRRLDCKNNVHLVRGSLHAVLCRQRKKAAMLIKDLKQQLQHQGNQTVHAVSRLSKAACDQCCPSLPLHLSVTDWYWIGLLHGASLHCKL